MGLELCREIKVLSTEPSRRPADGAVPRGASFAPGLPSFFSMKYISNFLLEEALPLTAVGMLSVVRRRRQGFVARMWPGPAYVMSYYVELWIYDVASNSRLI